MSVIGFTKKLIATAAIALALSGCASTVKQIPGIPGVTSTSVVLYVHNDGSGAILDGYVDRGIDKSLIEKYVRNDLGINSIVNLITVRSRIDQ